MRKKLSSQLPLDVGQRNRRGRRRRRRVPEWVRIALRNRRTLIAAFWMVKAIVQLTRLIKSLIDGS